MLGTVGEHSVTLGGVEVVACSPDPESATLAALDDLGVAHREFRLARTGVNPLEDLRTYRDLRRIAAEETTLGCADLIITSTQQEVKAQYGLYDYYRPEQKRAIPPGVDLFKFG